MHVFESTEASYNLGHKGWKFPFFAFCPPPSHACAMLTKHFDLTKVCICLFSNIERGDGGAGTYSIGITVTSSCFCHFPTQFVHGCSYHYHRFTDFQGILYLNNCCN